MVGRLVAWIARTDMAFVGGCGGFLLGFVCFDFFPPLGALELASAIVLILTRRRAASLFTMLPTLSILASAIAVMVTVSGPANPIIVPVAAWSILVAGALVAALSVTRTVAHHQPLRRS